MGLAAVAVRRLSRPEAAMLEGAFNRAWPWPRPPGFVTSVIATCPHLVAEVDGRYVGHCRVNPTSADPPFAAAGIPEVEDLNVMPPCRRQGAATALLDAAETLIATTSATAGLGVGLYDDYGPAQRLYSRRGYVLDGTGMWTHGRSVAGGQAVTADDDLVLYLTRTLG